MAVKRNIMVRLNADDHEVLMAEAYLRGSSIAEVARLAIESFVESRKSSPQVQRVLRERAEYEAIESGKLRPLGEQVSGKTNPPR